MQLALSDDLTENLVALDWFASLVDRHAKTHLVDGDDSLAAMLHEWRAHLPVNPVLWPTTPQTS